MMLKKGLMNTVYFIYVISDITKVMEHIFKTGILKTAKTVKKTVDKCMAK